jgi:uncharacterized lipoprotein YbaY
MSPDIGIRTRPHQRVTLTLVVGLIANTALVQKIEGTATYRERIALPAAAVFEATLEDVSRADAPAQTIANTRVTSPSNPPIAFTIAYEPDKIVADQIVKQWGNIRSYVIKDGHLFLSLMADGGIYEFEPVPKTSGAPKPGF